MHKVTHQIELRITCCDTSDDTDTLTLETMLSSISHKR